jgi:NAD(P)-dependent dehydrogenase (short-subunit alcohol dehydrogenase family)
VYWREQSKAGQPVAGRIINTVSGAGLMGNFGQSNYATAKAATAGLTQTLSIELYRFGVTVNAIAPAAATRIVATMPGGPTAVEANEIPDDEWNPMDPAVSSPVVAWLASDDSHYVTGQVFRATGETINLMKSWSLGPTVSNGGKRWDATKLGTIAATNIFSSRTPGIQLQ